MLSAKYITFAQITLQVAPGEYGGVTISPSLISSWKFIGDKDNPASCFIKAVAEDVNAGRGFIIHDGTVLIEGFTFQSYYHNISVHAGQLDIWSCHMTLSENADTVATYGGQIGLYGTMNIYGTSSTNIFTSDGGGKLWLGHQGSGQNTSCLLIYHNVTAAYNFIAFSGGSVRFHPAVVSFSGSLSAKKYQASLNGNIYTFGAGAHWIYGNQAGQVFAGGQVV